MGKSRARLLLLLLLTAACRHVPPDKTARAVAPPEELRRAPTKEEIRGAWRSTVLRGALADLGSTALYVFGPEGRYSGAIASRDEATGIEGTWDYQPGLLRLDDGALELRATLLGERLVGERLQLESADAYLELVRVAP